MSLIFIQYSDYLFWLFMFHTFFSYKYYIIEALTSYFPLFFKISTYKFHRYNNDVHLLLLLNLFSFRNNHNNHALTTSQLNDITLFWAPNHKILHTLCKIFSVCPGKCKRLGCMLCNICCIACMRKPPTHVSFLFYNFKGPRVRQIQFTRVILF